MSDVYYTVGEHGQPDEERCPHGVAIRYGENWVPYLRVPVWVPNQLNAQWYPLPAPPTEKAPAPKKWTVGPVMGTLTMSSLCYEGEPAFPPKVAEAAVARLNWPGPDWEGFERALADRGLPTWAHRTAIPLARRHLSPPEVP